MYIHNTRIDIRFGDLVHFPAEAILLPLDAGGLWRGGYHQMLRFSGVNGALQDEVGPWFHTRAAEQVLSQQRGFPIIQDGQAILVDGRACPQSRSFQSVIFVIDNLFYDLTEIVASGLKAAYAAKLTSVALPLIRSGVMTIVAGFATEALIVEMARGIRQTVDTYPDQPMTITILVTGDADERWIHRLPQTLRELGGPRLA